MIFLNNIYLFIIFRVKDERLDILKALSSKLHLNDDVRLEEIAIEAEHYSGADLQAVLYTAQLKAVHELAKGNESKMFLFRSYTIQSIVE